MCGIAGFWQKDIVHASLVAERTALAIKCRGPDDAGIWSDKPAGFALAHRRLSIIDISAGGHQPMISPCGRFVLVYNGEIYNHWDLCAELEGVGGQIDWRGHSDTEILFAGLRHWGVDGALKQLNGMFAFGVWDNDKRILVLARDRMGEKPLFHWTVCFRTQWDVEWPRMYRWARFTRADTTRLWSLL